MPEPLTALITGGAGFVGSHLCRYFLEQGHPVICLDSYLTSSGGNVKALLGRPGFTLVQQDISITGAAKQFAPDQFPEKIGFVLHLASPASPKDYTKYPIQTLQAGSMGAQNALEIASAHGATFLLASTSEVYGDPEVNPQPETYWGHVNPVGPRSMYDESKRFAEAITVAYHQAKGLDVRIARIFNTYGPNMRLDDGRALPNLIPQALRHQPLTVFGDGSQTRSFCYVDDLVEGLYRLATWKLSPPAIVNLGNPQEVTILQLAQEVIAATNSHSPIVFRPLPQDDPKVRRPDISRAKQMLDWSPKVSREEGLRRTIAYFKEALRGAC